ncbi:MAG: prepilin-type N-terminal cleavage/methylation domain-containing protein [Planctomycetota bacterium]|nr:prepilin-type N-terminal cleavage/methylation domain-containing protein [Planctomycetota bacterium]
MTRQPTNRDSSVGRGFTLAELLVVMGIIALLATLTGIAVQRIAGGSRLASGTNTVMAMLGEARAIAIRENKSTCVAFRVYRPWRDLDADQWPDANEVNSAAPQQTEIVIGIATGRILNLNPGSGVSDNDLLVEEFVPVPGVAMRKIANGIKIAGPFTDYSSPQYGSTDDTWITQPECNNTEVGSMLVVRFGPEGSIQTRNPAMPANITPTASSDTAYCTLWLDMNGNGTIQIGTTGGSSNGRFFDYDEFGDEPAADVVEFLAVYDDRDARERYNSMAWSGTAGEDVRRADLTSYIDQFADRIHFNRYTGVAGRVR